VQINYIFSDYVYVYILSLFTNTNVCFICFTLQQDQQNVDILPSDHGLSIEPSKRITTPFMTKYERARVLGTRALQIA